MTRPSGAPEMAPVVGAALPHVVHDTPAAVLLVDLEHQQVVYANELAVQLAPDTALPADVEAWSRAADLRTEDGAELQDGPLPLQRVAAGEPVQGERVSAARPSRATRAREALWVVGLPMTDAPPPLGRQALVVLLPVREGDAVAGLRRAGEDLRHRAVVASEMSFTITDPNTEDEPLVWVNPAFERVTGYRSEDVVGHNCRFLQGPASDPATVDRIRIALRENRTIGETLLNYRADGTAFWNQLVISPVFDARGRLTHRVGVQTDVTQRVEAAAERDRALAAARQSNERLQTLARISEDLSRRLDVDEALAALPSLVVPGLAGWAFTIAADDTVESDGRDPAQRVQVASADPRLEEETEELRRLAMTWCAQVPDVRHLLLGAGTEPLVRDLDPQVVADRLGERGARLLERLGLGQMVLVPLQARGRVLAVLGLVVDRPGGVDEDDLATFTDLGVRAGLAVDNARLYTREHSAALTLQRSLLPDVPQLPGFDVAAVYRPASVRAEVGGDWYDVLDLPGSGVGVAVGDVMGHDLRAAAAMGQLRSVLRSYAWGGDSPAEVVRRLDLLVRGLGMAGMATCVYAHVLDGCDGARRVVYARAGHPPPVLVRPGRTPRLLDQAVTTPIGVLKPDRPIGQAEVAMPRGSALVLYTDGLLERRDRPLQDGIAELTGVLAGAAHDASAADLCALLVERLLPAGAGAEDDACVLVIRHCG